MLIDLKDRVAIVTGAGRGIGLEIAATLAGEGVIIVGTDVRADGVAALAEAYREGGWRGHPTRCDVRQASEVTVLVGETIRQYGRVDILINNAGVAPGGAVETLSEDAWDLNMDVNLKGTFLMCQAVIPAMKRQRKGRILNAASFAAIVPIIGSAAYAASKAGVHYFTRVLAGELGPWNITVNSYAPGMIPTELNHFREQPEALQERLLDTLTLRRWGEARDVANLIAFLASDLAGYITGTLVDVSGGKLATQIPRLAHDAAGAAREHGLAP